MTFLEGLLHVLRAVESMLSWLFRYPLMLLQIVLILLIALAGLGSDLGLDDLFWSDSFAEQLVNGLGCGLLFGEIFLVRYLLDQWNPGDFKLPISLFPVADPEVKALGQYLAVFWTSSLLILAVPKLFYHDVMTGSTQVGAFWLGMALAVLLTSLAVVLASWRGLIDMVQNTRMPGAGGNGPLHAVAFLAALLFFVGGGSVYALHLAGAVLAPVFILCLLLALVDAVYGVLAFWAPGSQFVVLLVLVVGSLVAYSSAVNPDSDYKLTFPNLEEHYANRVRLDEGLKKGADGKDERFDHYYELLKAQAEGNATKPDLIPSDEPLHAMAQRWRKERKDDTKPRLVIVATSGGGIRAAVWTAVVLEGLERELKPPFREHIRMFTGASGGMVGASLYVADFENGPAGQRKLDPQMGLRELSGALAQDSLRRPVQTMLLHDLPSLWWPRSVSNDRGRELERIWAENTAVEGKPSPFRRSFAELQALERQGKRPSLVFSPMLVEDARRLLISNLDLLDMTWTSGSVSGFESFRKLYKIPNAPDQPMLSLSAVELFRLFPTVLSKFEVGTAARMNASFPLVSPGVSLPTTPPRRVVDAGYYDNHGVNLAAMWLYRHEKAIREHTSGVVIIEIRAYRNGYQRWHFQDKEAEKTNPDPRMTKADEGKAQSQPRRSRDALTASLEWLSTPAEAIMSARDRATYYRNDELLDGLSAHFNRTGGDFFTTLAFECEVDAALSWTLPASDATVIARAFHRDPSDPDPAKRMPRWIQKRVEALNTWFGDGGR